MATCPESCSGHGTCEYIEELAGDFYDRRTGPGNEFKDLSCADNRQFPSKSGAWSVSVDLNHGSVTTKLLYGTSASDYTHAYNGMAVKLDCNHNAKPTNLVCGAIYYIAKGATPDLALYTTKKQATMAYADSTAVVAGTGIITGEAGATAGDIYIFEEYDQACKEGSLITSNVVSRSANTDVYNGQQYQLWDAGKIQGCKCDLGYDGPDCSHRISPHGDDPLTTVKSNMMKQAVKINGKSSATFITEQFLMVYHDPYGGIWRTDAIDGTTNDNIAASRVQDALRALPNEVLEGVKVSGTASTPSICHRFDDGVQHLSAFEDFHIGHHKDAKYSSNFCEFSHTELAIANDDMDFTIEFADKPGQTGVQYLFEVDVSKRGAGAFPMSGGITGASSYSVGEINCNANLGNLSELAECSDRGLDDGDGQCECFDGFRGLSCEEQEALV